MAPHTNQSNIVRSLTRSYIFYLLSSVPPDCHEDQHMCRRQQETGGRPYGSSGKNDTPIYVRDCVGAREPRRERVETVQVYWTFHSVLCFVCPTALAILIPPPSLSVSGYGYGHRPHHPLQYHVWRRNGRIQFHWRSWWAEPHILLRWWTWRVYLHVLTLSLSLSFIKTHTSF